MAIKFEGKLLTGLISNDGPSSTGKRHGVINGETLCKSGLNFGSRYLHVTKVKTLKFFVENLDCSKCKQEIDKRIKAKKENE